MQFLGWTCCLPYISCWTDLAYFCFVFVYCRKKQRFWKFTW